ncbi:MAG: alpha-amylase [Bacteroidetes bacterium GWE2_41_25]|nr:MAG: alpha-amylase [Bacteroidetes bacterium GWE2_41_25]HCU17923.1 alpha-amylase [Bacteroidales bacterium]
MKNSSFPLLYQVNTRVWLTDLSRKTGRKATLDDIADSELDKLAASGFEWIWFLSVWQTGEKGKGISRQNKGWRKEFVETLPDLTEDDIIGSGFAISRYTVSQELGGDAALARLRNRLIQRGLKLMLDFVPNHTGPDHEWVPGHPDFFIRAEESDLEKEPGNFTRIKLDGGEAIFAHGRDPFFPGWPDTLQLNYGNPLLQEAMINELKRIAGQCDGVRCDMAMLVLPDVFERTWGIKCQNFWPEAIRRVHEVNADFRFMAEVYWDLEWTLIRNGFDYTYDKRLYDRLKEGHAKPVREHFFAGLDYQSKMARFLENHDEPRVAADFSPGMHEAAAIITFLSPGLRFFHQGQLEGRKKRISPHLLRAPEEPVNDKLEAFYKILIDILHRPVFLNGKWQLLDCEPAWEGNPTNDCFISFAWHGSGDERMLIVVNYSPNRAQCLIKLPFNDLHNNSWLLHDEIGDYKYIREGSELQTKGFYLDEPAWRIYVFSLQSDMSP